MSYGGWVLTLQSELANALLNKLKIHHSVYRLPCTSESLEELIANALNEAGFINDWQPNRSHSISVDMTVLDGGPSISVKSGTYDPKKRTLKFSGSRLGKHKTIDDMVDSVVSNSADLYVCVAKVENDWSPVPEKNDKKIYYLFVFDKSCVDYNSSIWYQKDDIWCLDAIGLSAYIRPSMSYQLWSKVDESLVGSPVKLDIM
jgi:hypothetical protein